MAVVSDVTGGGRSCRSDYLNSFFLWFRVASVKRKSYVSNNMKLLAVLLRVMSCVTKKEFFRQCLITSFKKHADKYSKLLLRLATKFFLVIS